MLIPNNSFGRLIRGSAGIFFEHFHPKLKRGKLNLEIWSLEDLVRVPDTITTREYQNLFEGMPIKQILDIGCNYGGFPLWLYGNNLIDKDCQGMCIDANFEQVTKALYFLHHLNELNAIQVAYGFVGSEKKFEDFNITEASSCSSKHTYPYLGGKITKDKVPVIAVDSLCRDFKLDKIDICNIDIEGGEYELLWGSYPTIIETAKWIIIEWHEPFSNLVMLREMLRSHKLIKIHIDSPLSISGTAFFKRKDLDV